MTETTEAGTAFRVDWPRLLCDRGHSNRGCDDVGDVVRLVVHADGGRGDGGDSLRAARGLDQLVGRWEPTAEQKISEHLWA